MSDIKFDGERVIVEGSVLSSQTLDIELDHPGRRSTRAGRRRALVHDFQDGLTLNWAEDYPGGVTLQGVVKIPRELQLGLVSGTHLRARHHDLHLDHPARRSTSTGNRRALVHDFQDGLTLNWAEDYPGGVTIRGSVNVPQGVQVGRATGTHLRLSHHDLHLDNSSRRSSSAGNRRALVHDFQDGLTLNYNQDYPGGVTIRGEVKVREQLTVQGQNVLQLLAQMQTRIDELTQRVEELEAALP
ncbi:MAG: hypothetical protein H0X65_20690 [Gemmatimonadetes bacterium]|nr:hypothetical protein [Gemmatimonadota bacterium]